MSNITRDELANLMPSKRKKMITQELVDVINEIDGSDSFHSGEFIDNFIHYGSVLANGRYTMKQYLSAVKFVTYLSAGDTVQNAYEKTFPEILARRLSEGKAESTMQSASVLYHRNKLVQNIITQSEIPLRLLFNKAKVDALNVLIDKSTDVSAGHRVNMESANMILTHLKDPNENKIVLQHEMSESSIDMIQDLRRATTDLVQAEMKALESGITLKDIAEKKLFIEAEIEDE